MTTFDELIQEIGSRYSLGGNACWLVQETFELITGLPGGIDGLLDRFKAAGFGVEVASWSEGSDPMPLTGQEAERMLGLDAIDKIANKAGISQNFAKTILGYAIPEIILLVRGGAVPPASPAPASTLVESSTPVSVTALEELSQLNTEQARTCGKEDSSAALRRGPIFKRLTGRGFRLAIALPVLCFAFAAGWYSSNGRSLFNAIQSPAQIAMPQTAEDFRSLKADVEKLRQAQSQSENSVTTVEGLKTSLDAVKAETAAAITGIAGRLDQTRGESEAKLSQLMERLDHLEHQIAMPLAAGPPGVPSPPGAPAARTDAQPADPVAKPPLESARGHRGTTARGDAVDPSQNLVAPDPRRAIPKLITNWVVRDVYRGVALVESPRGSIEVTSGDIIPGAGVVLSIERRGAGWIVITSRGLVDSAPDSFQPR
jgi:uncharacterized protein YidB (DUF937 family)